jgi:CBS domain-containing protein
VASREPVTVAPSEALDDAMELMARHKVRRLPVVDGGRLVGVVSQADIALGAKEAKTGAVVEQISQPTSVARER